MAAEPPITACRLRDLARYFLGLGTFGFGGPIALAVSKNRWVRAFVDGVTAAAAGAIAGAAFVLGRRAIIDVPTITILAGVVLVQWRLRKIPEPLVIAAAGVVGLAMQTWS